MYSGKRTPVDETRLRQIRNRAQLAEPGPRRIAPDGSVTTPHGRIMTLGVTGGRHFAGPQARAEARWTRPEMQFYQTARDDILDLVAEIERLQAELAKVRCE